MNKAIDITSVNSQVYVPLWSVIYAIRYGMNRSSYASGDAVSLAEAHWDLIPQFIKDQFRDDLELYRTMASMGPTQEVYDRWDRLFAAVPR